MERFDGDVFDEYHEHGEEYAEMINEDAESIREEFECIWETIQEKREEYKERFGEEIEKTSAFTAEQMEIVEQINELYDKHFELQDREQRIFKKAVEAGMLENIETKIRPQSEYWADKYSAELKEVKEDEVKETAEMEKNEKLGKVHIDPYPSATLRKIRLDTKIELASTAFNPDQLGELVNDYDGLLEYGLEYFQSKEGLSKRLDKVSYEQAMESLDNLWEKEEISDDNYYSLKAQIRSHYGK